MNSNRENLSYWLLFGLLSIPLVLLMYFYLLLHLGFGLPLNKLVYPALILCGFVPFFSAFTYWGYRNRLQGRSGVKMFIALWAFALLCGFEFRHFETQLGSSPTSSGFVIAWASVITIGGYYLEKWVRNARVRKPQG